MLGEAIRALKYDRRLAARPGWVSAEELERELATLADARSKAAEPPVAPEPPGASGEPATNP